MFQVPLLKVGSLDVLLDCSESLAKLDNLGEQIAMRHIALLEEVSGKPRADVATVQPSGQSTEVDINTYLTAFQWDEAKFQSNKPIKVLIAMLQKDLHRADDGTKAKLSEYTEVKTKWMNFEKKRSGTLASKPLGDLVRPWAAKDRSGESYVNTEHLTTLFVVMPKGDQAAWEKEYPNLDGSQPGAGMVVPGSSQLVAKEDDLVMVSVVLFKRVADDFKSRCRLRKWTVRDYDPATELSAEDAAKLEAHKSSMQSRFEQWLKGAFSEVFMTWAHIKAVRLFDEALLRYGLPPQFSSMLVQVSASQEKALRRDLGAAYKHLESKYGADDTPDGGALELRYPYVSLVVPNIASK